MAHDEAIVHARSIEADDPVAQQVREIAARLAERTYPGGQIGMRRDRRGRGTRPALALPVGTPVVKNEGSDVRERLASSLERIKELEEQIRTLFGAQVVEPAAPPPPPDPVMIVFHSISAKGIPNADAGGGSDPYARFTIIDDFTANKPGKNQIGYTSYIQNELDPNWAGERLQLLNGLGETIANFRFNDRAPWPEAAGKDGVSLILRASALPEPDYEAAGNWASSAVTGGTPNADEFASGFSGEPTADNDRDGYPSLIEYILGTSDDHPGDTANRISTAVRSVEVGELTQNYLTMSFRRITQPGNVRLVPQFSVNLEHWFEGDDFVPLVSEEDLGDGTSLVTYRASLPQQEASPQLFMRLRAEIINE